MAPRLADLVTLPRCTLHSRKLRPSRKAALGAAALAWFLAGCSSQGSQGRDSGTSADAAQSDGGYGSFDAARADVVVRVTLTAEKGSVAGQGYDLDADRVASEGASDPSADFYLSTRMIVSLGGKGTFCSKGLGYATPLDVPLDATGCVWGVAELGGNVVRPASLYAGAGFLVRSPDGQVIARLVIVSDVLPEAGPTEVVFDVAAVGPTSVDRRWTIQEFALPGPDSRPHDILAGIGGVMWFTEQKGTVGRISMTGRLAEYPVPKGTAEIVFLGGIAQSVDGDIWTSSAWFPADVYKVGRRTTTELFTILDTPIIHATAGDLAITPDGTLWGTALHNSTSMPDGIFRMTPAGVVSEFPIRPEATPPLGLTGPAGLAFGPDGNVWFVEALGHRIGRITPAGVVTEFPIPTPEARPTSIVLGTDGALWFTEEYGHKIGRITTSGEITEFPLPGQAQPMNIAAAPDGNLWFTEYDVATNSIGRITPAGVVTEFPIPTPASQPWDIAIAANGTVWFTEYLGNKIGRLTP